MAEEVGLEFEAKSIQVERAYGVSEGKIGNAKIQKKGG